MKTVVARYSSLALLFLSAAVTACDQGTGPHPTRPVQFRLATAPQASVSQSAGALGIDSIRLVVVGAALGGAEQFGCVDCQGGQSASPAPTLITVTMSTGPVPILTEEVTPSRYSQVEIQVGRPPTSLLAVTPDWPADASIQIVGRVRGTAFRLALPIEGSFRETLAQPVDVTSSGSERVEVTITLPVATWFVGATGTTLDPADPVQRAEIVANARRAFAAPERSEER
ncbi:MAG: hypothetical protein ACYC7F_07240, partial [Gemmatimonadaceae bacterium]